MLKNIILLKFFLVLTGTVYTQEGSIATLLPESKFYKKLNKIEISKVYTNDDLFEVIDGGADIFMEYGFQNYIQGTYVNKKIGSFMIEIYEMSDEGAALGIFSVLQVKEATKVNVGVAGSLTDYFIAFYRNNYFIRISVQNKLDSCRTDMQAIANYIDARIPNREDGDNIFAKNMIEAYGIQNCIYFRGNIAFSNIIFFHSKNIFRTKAGVHIKQNKYDFIALEYSSHTDASEIVKASREALETYRNNQTFLDYENGYSYLNRKGLPVFILQDKNFCFIVISKQNLEKELLASIITKNAALLADNNEMDSVI